MKYIVCQEPGHFEMLDKDPPVKKTGEALLRIMRIGICGTDLHAYRGNQPFFTYPRILGHELAAEIVEIDLNKRGLRPGDRVAIMPYLSCGQCIACRHGKTNCCVQLQVLGVHTDGGMQEFISLPIEYLLPANHLSFEEIAVVEPLAIGAHAVKRAAIQSGEQIVVVGCGPIGIGLMKLAQQHGAEVIAVDVNEERLALVREKMDIRVALKADRETVDRVRAVTNGDMATAVFDATGNKQAMESGVNFMAHGGRYVLVGLFKGMLNYHHPQIHAKEASILCSRNATLQDFQTVMRALEGGALPLDAFITHRVTLEEMIDHFDSWLQPETGVVKAMINTISHR